MRPASNKPTRPFPTSHSSVWFVASRCSFSHVPSQSTVNICARLLTARQWHRKLAEWILINRFIPHTTSNILLLGYIYYTLPVISTVNKSHDIKIVRKILYSSQWVCTYDNERRVLTWTQKLSDELNLAHVARKKYEKKKLKQTPVSTYM